MKEKAMPDFVDPWEQERREKRKRVLRWVIGEKPPKAEHVVLLALSGLLIASGSSIGVMTPGHEPIWAAIPCVPVVGYLAIGFAVADIIRLLGHSVKLWISRGIRASEVQEDECGNE